ncbi:MAG: hypothetical protein CVU56_17385 [Deltaproteobacteria bacterium HGW-Deltaproteobacteria-14]|nr:MAG: hypothetical protein CVU56_17385 [Deltaproteobacteria bacterium HGW-Deltaproteobacteria-14]
MFLITAIAMAADVVADLAIDSAPPHVLLEVFIMVAAFAGVAWFSRELRRERAAAREMSAELDHAQHESKRWRAEADRWREEAREALDGLGNAIELQFQRWELTAAEAEVALLLLKGLSHKESAEVRGVSERTVRQQALAVYRKAEVAGRAELSAFFLEDLLLPRRSPRDLS